MEKILNKYLKVELIEHDSFISTEKGKYEEIGVVVNKDESITEVPIGAKIYFDSWMAKKYPVLGQEGKYEWFVPLSEVIKCDVAE